MVPLSPLPITSDILSCPWIDTVHDSSRSIDYPRLTSWPSRQLQMELWCQELSAHHQTCAQEWSGCSVTVCVSNKNNKNKSAKQNKGTLFMNAKYNAGFHQKHLIKTKTRTLAGHKIVLFHQLWSYFKFWHYNFLISKSYGGSQTPKDHKHPITFTNVKTEKGINCTDIFNSRELFRDKHAFYTLPLKFEWQCVLNITRPISGTALGSYRSYGQSASYMLRLIWQALNLWNKNREIRNQSSICMKFNL